MAVLSVYVAGVSTSGIELINEAVSEVFGECEIFELNRDNMRYKVRSANSDSSVALVILDDVSKDTCKDIAGDLYDNTAKFFNYTNDKDLAIYLNDIFDLSLEIPEDMSGSDETSSNFVFDSDDKYDALVSQLADKDGIIRNLNLRIQELERIIDEEGYSVQNDGKDIDTIQNENIDLNNRIADLKRDIDDLEKNNSKKDTDIVDLNDKLEAINIKYESLKRKYDTVNDELSQERVSSSTKSGVIRDKDEIITNLNGKVAELENKINAPSGYIETIADLKSKVGTLTGEIDKLKVDISSKDFLINNLNAEVAKNGEISENIATYKGLLADSREEVDSLKNEKNDLLRDYNDLSQKYDKLVADYDDLDSRYTELNGKYTESEGFVTKLNTEVISLKEKVRVLDSSDDGDKLNSVLSELSGLRRKFTELQSNLFNIISTKSLPQSNIKVPLFKGILNNFKNIKFQFSGSVESRKGTYKCLFNECMGSTNDKFLIVDVTSETAIDYVFQMKKIVDGTPWLVSGGGVQKYLSQTCLPNVKVLMPKLGYINDSYFLMVNWEKRLIELENSGYKVIVYCGDISNLVGRVLFESFSDVGYTAIYVHGNAIGSRSIIANSGGLIGIKNSIVGYYDFDKNMVKFYNMMSKKCQCKIITYAQGV